MERARVLLADGEQAELDLGVEPSPIKANLVSKAGVDESGDEPLFPAVADERAGHREQVSSPQVVATSSRLLFDTLAGVYDDLRMFVIAPRTAKRWADGYCLSHGAKVELHRSPRVPL